MLLTSQSAHPVRVAIIDSGIDPTHEKIGTVHEVCLDSVPRQTTRLAGHGTACAGIIRQIAPTAILYDVRIFDESLTTDGSALLAAIRWTIEQPLDVVNLSLGTTDVTFRDGLAEVCRQARDAGVILVAAEHNDGRESYPAVLSDVIGVTGGKVRGRYGYYYRPGHAIECVARGDAQRVCWIDPPYVMVSGTSFATPHITGVVALIRQAYPNAPLEQVRELLQANALQGMPELLQGAPPRLETAPEPSANISDLTWIQKAALYPFNKEMHALVRARDLLAFSITGIADPVGKGLVGKDAGKALGLSSIGVRIRPRLADALKEADTLILGYVDQLGRIGKKDVLHTAVETALAHNCHVFSFLSVSQDEYGDLYDLARKKGLHLTYPSIASDDVQQALQAESSYVPVDVPVLGVFGTSSQQGKFTLQLILRRHLLRLGYRVGQIGTEHHAALFGMDLAFPMGYASNVTLPLQYYVPYLDYKLRQLSHQKRPDIILVGSQSGTIPYDVHEHRTHSLISTAFLLGTKPDACILVVNSIDADEYIQDTIDGLRALAKAPTLLLAMSDQEKHIRAAYGRTFIKPRPMNSEEITRILHRLEDRFSLPVVSILSEEGQQQMVDTVVNHFAADQVPCQRT